MNTVNGEEVLRSWNSCHGAFYQLSELDLLWNLREQSLLNYWVENLDGIPALWAEAAPAGVDAGIPPKGLWLSVNGEVPAGGEDAFALAAEKFARERGQSRLAIGSDEFHFLPGIPVDDPAGKRLAQAFAARGFATADNADFVGAPTNPQSAGYITSAREDAERRGWTLRLVGDARDQAELSDFLQREFPGRWSREWLFWRGRPDTGRAFWNLLRDEKNQVLGFSRLARRGRMQPAGAGWTPGALRLPLSPGARAGEADSCLGPIGIAKSERGRGAGKILLGLSLRELSEQGAGLTCIDWTNAYNYYTPLGFRIVRRYLCAWKAL